MKSSHFSLSTDSSNDQNLEKRAKVFDEDEHKVVTHFMDMYLSKSARAESIFQSVNWALEKHEIPWANCIALGVCNTSVYVGKHKSLIVEVQKKNSTVKLMGCPWNIAHSTAHHATDKFKEEIDGFKKKSLKIVKAPMH